MSCESGSKILAIVDVGIIIGVIVCGWLAFFTYTKSNDLYTQSVTSTMVINNESVALISFNFTSDVFSAQNKIEVSVIGEIDPDFKQKHPSILEKQQMWIALPDGLTDKPIYLRGAIQSAPIILTKGHDELYRGNTTITYQFEGDKCFVPLDPGQTTSPRCYTGSDPILHISSADSLFQLRNNKTTLSLSYVFLAFTIFMGRDFAKDFFQNLILLNKKKKGSSENKINPDKKKGNPK